MSLTERFATLRLRNLIEPSLRRVLHLYWRMQRGMTLGARAIVIDADNRVFLIQHTYARGWHLPGGGVEVGETMIRALARELREEGNIELEETPPLHGMFFNKSVSLRDHVAVYVVTAFHQHAPMTSNAEIAAAGFFSLDELPGDTTAGTRARIAEVMMNAPRSDVW